MHRDEHRRNASREIDFVNTSSQQRPERPLRLNYSLFVAETDQGLAINVADADPITLQGDYELLLRVLAAADGVAVEAEIVSSLRSDYSQDQVTQALEFARSRNLVREVPTIDLIHSRDLGKWDRQIRNFTNLSGVSDEEALSFHQQLAESHVLVLGVGGVGGYVASAAAMMGIERLTVADFDTIELSNTSRQILYTEADLGRAKLEVAVQELSRRAPAASINAIDIEVTDVDSMKRLLDQAIEKSGHIDLLVLCADQPRGKIAYIVDQACSESMTPVLMCGPHDFSWASVGPLIIPGTTASYSELFPKDSARMTGPLVSKVNDRFVANIMEPYNGLAAKMALVEAVKFLSGYARPFVEGRVVDIDTANWSMTVHDFT